MAWQIVGQWSYSGDPSASNLDEVRFRIGDVDDQDQLVSDEEINYAIADEGSNVGAAAQIAEHLAARFAREADKTVNNSGATNITYSLSQRAKAYAALAKRLRSQVTQVAIPYAGGISVDAKDTVDNDTDRVEPAFKRGQFDNSTSY